MEYRYNISLKIRLLLEDGKVYVTEKEVYQIEEILKQRNIEYFLFDLKNGTYVFELKITE